MALSYMRSGEIRWRLGFPASISSARSSGILSSPGSPMECRVLVGQDASAARLQEAQGCFSSLTRLRQRLSAEQPYRADVGACSVHSLGHSLWEVLTMA